MKRITLWLILSKCCKCALIIKNKWKEWGAISTMAMLYSSLKRKIKENTHELHRTESAAREAKYPYLIEEQNALVMHLQAELEEIVPLMPVRYPSSSMIVEEEADKWVKLKSREIGQYCDNGGLDWVITELHGGGNSEGFDNAAKEAEMSLRRVSEEASLDGLLDDTTLLTFGTRQLRAGFLLLRGRLIRSEGRFEELMRVSDGIGRREEQMKGKVGVLEGAKETINLLSQKQK